VLGDRTQLEQAVMNLALNGIEAMANAPAAIRELTIKTRAHQERGTVELVVLDNGSGISPDCVPHLFESFFTTKAEGTGLGLHISRSIIRSHGGQIWAENSDESGAAFHFTLPVN
jgi:signal transduction histidine kinase